MSPATQILCVIVGPDFRYFDLGAGEMHRMAMLNGMCFSMLLCALRKLFRFS